MTIVGTIGGLSISLSLVPQVYLTYKTKCADDISYFYQFIYIFGAALVNAYAIYFKLWAVYGPCLLELCLIVTLTIMKYMYPSREDLKEITRQSIAIGSGTQSSVDMKSLSMAMQKMESIRNLNWDDDGDEEQGDNPATTTTSTKRRPTLESKKSSRSFRSSFFGAADEENQIQHQNRLMERKSIALMKRMSVRDMKLAEGNEHTELEEA